MSPKLTRREIVAAFAGAAPLLAPAQTPAPAEDEDAAARSRVQSVARRLDQVPLPMATEPAFQFKA
jgi:hypothetical protein